MFFFHGKWKAINDADRNVWKKREEKVNRIAQIESVIYMRLG